MNEKNKWIISTIVAFLGIIIPIVLYITSLPERSIAYEVVSKTDLVGSLNNIKGVEITINGKQANEATLYLIKFKNTGTEPITVEDFEKPILLKLNSQVFSVKVKDKTPENLSLEYSIEENNVSIKPLLFNSDEEFSLEIVSSSEDYPIVDSRIAGVSEINESYPSENSLLKVSLTLILSFSLMLFYSKFAYQFSIQILKGNNKTSTPSIIITLILSITCAFSSLLLAKTVIDLESYMWYIYIAIVPTIILGMYLVKLEEKQHKPVQSN